MIETLAKMKHHIWTVFGESKTRSSQNNWGEPIVGIGHGISMGLTIWAEVSTPMFNTMWEDGLFALIVCAVKQC